MKFCAAVGFELEPQQKVIARAAFGEHREIVAVVPKGQGKTRTLAALGVHHLVSAAKPVIYSAASSREQGAILFEEALALAEHPALEGLVQPRYLKLLGKRGAMTVLSAEGRRAHGTTGSLYLLDELWAFTDAALLEAFLASLVKNPAAKLLTISTASAFGDSPLSRYRTRALSQPNVHRDGAFMECRGEALHWLEWSLPEGADLDDMKVVKSCNPSPRITRLALRAQREAVPEPAFAQFHCNVWGAGEGRWLPPGSWANCKGDCSPADGEEVVLGIDIGGSRASSAIIGVTDDLRVVVVDVFEGNEAVLAVTERVHELAARFTLREVAYDPWRYRSEALRLEAELGLTMVEFPQSHSRMTVASEGLHKVIVEGKLTHPAHPELDRHIANAVVRQTGRGWRLDKRERSANIDCAVALAMACERAQHQEPPAKFHGWL